MVSQSGACLFLRTDGVPRARGEEYLSAPCGPGNREKSWGRGLACGEDIHIWILREGCAEVRMTYVSRGDYTSLLLLTFYFFFARDFYKHCNPPAFWIAAVNCSL